MYSWCWDVPGQAPPLGGEGAGVVVEIGHHVRRLSVGPGDGTGRGGRA
ncbi:hypothetical protein I551_3682 [Mycobacterium ulcerans str. Harvey]|uniref:Uncharacterized protein n=1 Tax=Mycobacterium ulcerans str. Harvey TaxID=1299332 RepID=A0ABN0QYT1_MYCUL|nr:hypothetical protein I551_3682 [Mycobacterium ulcerans str. Harvey]